METRKASRLAGGLLASTGLFGILILATDQILRESLRGQHWYGLIVFVIIDFVVATYVIVRPSRTGLTIAAGWSILRIIVQFTDIASAPQVQMSYGDFANYLFNPTLTTDPNPTGVPGALIDLIITLELIVIGAALGGRSAAQKPRPHS